MECDYALRVVLHIAAIENALQRLALIIVQMHQSITAQEHHGVTETH